jgi:hypothetical protein
LSVVLRGKLSRVCTSTRVDLARHCSFVDALCGEN